MTGAANPNAFPACNEANVNGTMGMTLRDWFAGQFASEAAAREYGNDWGIHGKEFPVRVAAFAYHLADAMLAAREQGK